MKQALPLGAIRHLLLLPTLTLLILGFLQPAVRAGFYWTNTVSGNWSSAANWTNDTGLVGAPAAAGQTNYVLNFNKAGTYTATSDLNNGFLLNLLSFSGPTLTLAGNDLAFTNNGVTPPQINQNSAVTVTVGNNLVLGNGVTLGGSGNGAVSLNGVISGAGSLTKNSPGTLTLNDGTNTYGGGTIINAGTVGFAAGNGSITPFFGTGPVTINSPATLACNRTWLTNNLTLNGATVTSGNSFASTLAGSITLAASPTFNITGGFAITGNMSGPGGFTNAGTTTLPLSGSSTFAGPVVVTAGTLSLGSFNSVSGGAPASNLGAPTTAANGTITLGSAASAVTLLYTGPGETTDRILNLTGGITLAQGGTGPGIPVTQAGQSGLLKFTSDLSIPGTAGTDSRKTLTLANPESANSGYVMGRGEFAGAIGDSVLGNPGQLATSLTMVGPGYWTLSGSNSYSGITEVQAGVLVFTRAGALGTNTLDIASGAKVELDFVGTRQIGALTFNGGAAQPNGTYGASSSMATTKDDVHFVGMGTLTIGPITSPTTNTLALTSGTNPSSGGAALTFTATVTGGNAPSGNVVFYDGLTVLGTNSLSGGQATFSTSILTNGAHTISAFYAGNSSNAPSASSLAQTVVDTRSATTTTLARTAGANPSSLGAAVTFMATVAGATPTGTVVFYNGTTAIGSATLNGLAQASLTISNLASGWNGMMAGYLGDANNAPSATTLALWQTVKPPAGNGKLKVFILAGQSNMQGKGEVENGGDPNNPGTGSVPGGLGTLRRMLNTNTNKYGYLVDTNGYANTSATTVPGWRTLTNVWVSYFTGTNINNDHPGSYEHRKGYLDADFGNYSSQGEIGPEYGFGLVVGSQLGDPVLIIKTAWGGTSLTADWRPPSSGGTVGPCYSNMVANVYHTLGNLSSEFTNFNYSGGGYEIVGFGWHQGYNDIGEPEAQYETNLVNFIHDVRAEFGVPNLPFAIDTTGMSDASGSQLWICEAQAAAANPILHPELAGTVFTVDARPFDYGLLMGPTPSQGYHWYHNAQSYFNIGQSMGLGLMSLLNNPPAVTNLPATGLTANAVTLNATVIWPYVPCNLNAYWGPVNGGTNVVAWTHSAPVGSWFSGTLTNVYGYPGDSVLASGAAASVVATNLSFTATGLAPNSTYYYTFCATNQTISDLFLTNTRIQWATNAQSFTTLAWLGPAVDNTAGAANLSVGMAQLRGMLTNGPADVQIYWGATDGVMNPGAWASTNFLTGATNGGFSTNVSNLLYGVTYYYRTYASNQLGAEWAPATTSFTTLRPDSSLANSAATVITADAAAFNATLSCTGAVYQVSAFWNTVNGGTNAALWTNSAYVGSRTNAASTNLSYLAAGLLPGTTYYFSFLATNAIDTLWATNVLSFTTTKAAYLTSLVPSAGTLNPAFASGIFSYTVTVPYSTNSLRLKPTAADTNSIITVNGSSVVSGNPSGTIALAVGANVITTVVVSADLGATNTYTLTVTRAGNAYLANLVSSAGTLNPAFATNLFSYTASVPNATNSLAVTPTAADPGATIKVNGNLVISGSPSGSISLNPGANLITTVVLSFDARETNTYALTVTRAASVARWWDGGTMSFAASGDGAGGGGAGTWDSTTLNWDQGAGLPHLAWNNANNDTAILGGTPGTVTLGTGITVGALEFDAGGYTITNSTLTFGAAGFITNLTTGGTTTIGSVIAGSAGLATAGAGTLTLNGPVVNTFNGGLALNGGTLAEDLSNMTGGYANLINSGNTLAFGGGALTLKGNSANNSGQTFGNVTVNAGGGSLLVNPNGASRTVTNTLGTFTVTAAGGSLTLGKASGASGTAVVTTTSGLDSTGIYGGRAVWFNGTANTGYDFASTASSSSPYTLSAYGGYVTALPTIGSLSSSNYAITAGISLSGTESVNTLKITGSATALALNSYTFTLQSGGLLSAGTTAQTISGAGTLSAGNGSGSYDLVVHQYNSGGLTISSVIGNNGTNAVNLVKAGTANLILSGANTYTGNTYVNAGMLVFGATTPPGSGGIYMAPGTSVQVSSLTQSLLNRIAQTTAEITVMTGTAANALDFSGTGANLPNAFLGDLASNGAKTEYSGSLTPGNETYRLGSATSSGTLGMLKPLTDDVGNPRSLIVGGSSVDLVATNTFSGDTTIRTGGHLLLGNNLALQNSALNLGTGSDSITGNFGCSSGALSGRITGDTTSPSPAFGGLKGGRNLLTAYSSSGYGNNGQALAATSVTGFTLNVGAGRTCLYSGGIADFASGTTLALIGAGTQIFSGANTYTGGTTNNSGTLLVNNISGSGTGTGAVVVNGGILGGTGTIGGGVTVNSGGTLWAGSGAGNPGTLTLNSPPTLGGTVWAELYKGNSPSNTAVVVASHALTYGGILVVSNNPASSPALASGDSFALFNAAGYSGWFSSLSVPALAAGISWDTNKLAMTGVLDIYNFSTTNLALATPVNSNVVVSAARLAQNNVSSARAANAYPAGWTAAVATAPTNGTAAIDGSANLTYTPKNNYSGADNFTVMFYDGHGSQSLAVSVTVGGGNSQSPSLTGQTAGGTNYVLQFGGLPGDVYTVETNRLLGPGWAKLGDFTVPGNGNIHVTNALGTNNLFFRTVWPSY